MNRIRNNRGFTLIELMIVVVIIGILAALAIPRYMTASAKSKQSEAKAILKQVYEGERAYFHASENNTYWTPAAPASAGNRTAFAELCVEIGASARYTYTITTAAGSFTATATANIDDDAVLDTWTINEQGVLTNTVNDILVS
ncbi:MAG TPA: prepilin-type N-terminal cleavage/methylation domain-containing protein [candidate division Zixibacteria bacterium]|nr:prepilin-type N-terminal cleavage/methylation domain-containing protein [candidate division Zixibacteria bacterium]MDD4916246.1 prepilin-type N-terminal cleavage/methylation domain-containing protein [candidate division Zixibacteria bacterium]MDM7973156.1 prepilin-type N-terminal cleavage/methylation domain-containing protein [candidate division Zixibacteria bacterium]HOD67159.1 prepilin-type N-terminal cleavage/methylation domain-containing protein [candidate division Zixibacteria bacterium]